MSKTLRVGHSPLSNKIYAGKVLKDGRTWATGKSDVTLEALSAAAFHVLQCGGSIQLTDAEGSAAIEIHVKDLRKPDEPVKV